MGLFWSARLLQSYTNFITAITQRTKIIKILPLLEGSIKIRSRESPACSQEAFSRTPCSVFCLFSTKEKCTCLTLRLLGFFNDNFFILVIKIIMNICTVAVFMIPQCKIANSCWFICLIQTFIENATWCCNKGDWCIVSGRGVRSCIKYF